MNGRHIVLLTAAIGSLALTGCAQDTTHAIGAPILDSHFGKAVQRARAMQVLYPEGTPAHDASYSGKAAQAAMERLEPPAASPAPASSAPLPSTPGKATK